MRILYVTDALAIWGGLERVLVEKANYLATHDGNEVFMLTISQGDHPFPFPLEYGDSCGCEYPLLYPVSIFWHSSTIVVETTAS